MTPKADIPSKMTVLLTRDERRALDDIRRARGDRSAAATIRALIREDAQRLPLRLRDVAAHPGFKSVAPMPWTPGAPAPDGVRLPPTCAECGQVWSEGDAVVVGGHGFYVHGRCYKPE